MRNQLLSIAVALALTAPAFADPVTVHTVTGETLKGELIRLEPDGIALETDSGISKIPFANLTPEDRAKFGFDPKAAAAYREAVANAQYARSRALNTAGDGQAPAEALAPDAETDARLQKQAHEKAVADFKKWQAGARANNWATTKTEMPSVPKMEAEIKAKLVDAWKKEQLKQQGKL
jgi:hypothetical protein